jgi:hypothetical protein
MSFYRLVRSYLHVYGTMYVYVCCSKYLERHSDSGSSGHSEELVPIHGTSAFMNALQSANLNLSLTSRRLTG